MKNFTIRALTGIVYAGVMIGMFFIPHYLFLILLALFTLIGGYEFFKITHHKFENISTTPFLLFAISLFLAFFFIPKQIIPITLIILTLTIIISLSIKVFKVSDNPILETSISLLPIFWIAIPMGILSFWHLNFDCKTTILSTLILIWLSDTFAYCGGSLFGKHKMIERISPKKTWEGFGISLILTIATAIGISFIPLFNDANFSTIGSWIGFAIVVNLSGTLGDLVESMVKRNVNVKDSGNFLPGHGGWLDRFDSILFAIPLGFLYWIAFYLIH